MTDVFTHPGIGDDVAAAVAGSAPEDVLRDAVLSELKRDTSRPNILLEVPDRPGWSVEYSVMLNADLLKTWQKQVTDQGEIDMFGLALRVLANQCRGLRREGQQVTLKGAQLVFASQEIGNLYNSIEVTNTVREFYGNDTAVSAAYVALLQAAGGGDRLDPTVVSPA